jgi:plastocyanin
VTLALVAAVALGATGCGGDGDTVGEPAGQDEAGTEDATDEADASDADAADDADADAAGDGAGDGQVEIVRLEFTPGSVTVAAGGSVTWSNTDSVAHTVTSGSPGDADGTFDESLSGGGEASVTFDESGTFAYFCAIHPNMTGEVVVE